MAAPGRRCFIRDKNENQIWGIEDIAKEIASPAHLRPILKIYGR